VDAGAVDAGAVDAGAADPCAVPAGGPSAVPDGGQGAPAANPGAEPAGRRAGALVSARHDSDGARETVRATVRVVLVDDQPLIRSALRVLIADADDLAGVGEAGNGEEAVTLVRATAPDVVVMDIRMPGVDGIEATRSIAADDDLAGVRILVLTTFDDDEYVYGALRAGASGFVVKDMALDDILGAIRVVAGGEALIAPRVTRLLIEQFLTKPSPASKAPLGGGVTEREQEVLTLIGRGRSNSEIAAELHITIATVKAHVARLLTKLDARDRIQLVIIAYETGLVSADNTQGTGRAERAEPSERPER
jgi:DNA-binding NarL/FixJ family response regulator